MYVCTKQLALTTPDPQVIMNTRSYLGYMNLLRVIWLPAELLEVVCCRGCTPVVPIVGPPCL